MLVWLETQDDTAVRKEFPRGGDRPLNGRRMVAVVRNNVRTVPGTDAFEAAPNAREAFQDFLTHLERHAEFQSSDRGGHRVGDVKGAWHTQREVAENARRLGLMHSDGLDPRGSASVRGDVVPPARALPDDAGRGEFL